MVHYSNEFATLWQKSGLSLEALCELLDYSPRTIKRWEAGDTSPRKASILTLQNFIEEARRSGRALGGDEFRFIDLFAGIGGIRRGFDEIGGKCVFTSEWNSYAVKTYRANFPDDDEHQFNGDITTIDAKDIPAHDVLLGGFPCQPFSIAGVSKKNSLGKAHGFRCEAQGTLFFDVARIIEHHQPKAFVLENVKNLVNHDRGNTFRVIRKTLEQELGYHISYRVIDAKGFVPQHRERIFIVGFRDKNSFTLDDLEIPNPLSGPKLGTILHPEDGSEGEDGHFTDKKGKVNKRYVLTDKLWNYLQAYAEKHRKKGNGFGFGLVGAEDTTRTLSARYYKDGSEILVKRRRGNPRRLTPRECARLMGFDTPKGSDFKIPVSDTQAYKQFGNAVVVPVVTAVAKHMAPYILQGEGANRYAQRELLELVG